MPVRCGWSQRRGMEYPLFIDLATLLILPILPSEQNMEDLPGEERAEHTYFEDYSDEEEE